MEAYSVLMTVYRSENAPHFERAINSVLSQTVPTDDFIIVCDGPLVEALDAVIDKYTAAYPDIIHVLRLEQNMGIGAACDAGIRLCRHDLVAKMDADDISMPGRCEAQLRRFAEVRDLTILGGDIEEFGTDPDAPFSVRSVPKTNPEIRAYARRRQPFNNVTVMMRRSAVLDVGGYRPLRRNEDYDLYIRLLHRGYYAENLPQILVKVRVDSDSYHRRCSFSSFRGILRSRWTAFAIGYSTLPDLLYCCLGSLFLLLCPGKVRKLVYMTMFRRKLHGRSDSPIQEKEYSRIN